jgi:hypothetical protein
MRDERDALYRAFERHPLKRIVGCDHCVSPEEIAALSSAPLALLDVEVIGRYAFKAMSTWGDEADYRHFLPRILELACEHAPPWPGFDLDLVARKILDAGWREWKSDERAAVERYLNAGWCVAITTDRSPTPRDYLEAFETLGLDAVARLGTWRAGVLPELIACAEFVLYNYDLPVVAAFARDPETVAAFERAFLAHDGGPVDLEPLARAADLGRF